MLVFSIVAADLRGDKVLACVCVRVHVYVTVTVTVTVSVSESVCVVKIIWLEVTSMHKYLQHAAVSQ